MRCSRILSLDASSLDMSKVLLFSVAFAAAVGGCMFTLRSHSGTETKRQATSLLADKEPTLLLRGGLSSEPSLHDESLEIPVHVALGSQSAQFIAVDWGNGDSQALSGLNDTGIIENGDKDHPGAIGDTLWIHIKEGLLTDGGYKEDYWLQFESSLPIVDIDSRGANDFIVALDAGYGWTVFERWYLQMPLGSWTAGRAAASAGPPHPPLLPPQVDMVVGGGAFIPLANRASFPTLRRKRFAQRFGDSVKSLLFDPDGRFALIMTPNTIFRLDIASESLAVIVDGSTLDMGYAEIDDSYIGANSALGRVVVAESHGHIWGVAIFDSDNDGSFDSTEDIHTLDRLNQVAMSVSVDF